ncbi:MAG TPA: trypsin-like peptidase domain-containing protein [Candidatus Limnocylindria bacterium]|nr:trypsin-like peptidase domain-containing protein [Candidatus Limnocylindria bacterium]
MTDRPAERPDQPTTSYSPPVEGRPSWTGAPAWSQQTPERWFEPMPEHVRPQPVQGTASGRLLAVVFVVGLLAAALGSLGTFMALELGGRLTPPSAPALSAASPSPSAGTLPNVTPLPAREDDSTVTRAAEAVSPAVVTISVGSGQGSDTFPMPETGVGSGVIFDSAGWVLTNRHVVAGETTVQVVLQDGQEIEGTVYGEDTLTDLAIVKLDAVDLPYAVIGDSSQLKPGQLAVAIGSPLGAFTNSVTSGVVSALGRDVPVTDPVSGERRWLRNLIQTDAAINPGNSGGALIDAAGTVIGINTAVASQAQGIGFAIPVNIAKPLLEQALAGEPLARPWIGISYLRIDRDLAEREELPIDYGVLVNSSNPRQPAVARDSPAQEASIEEGDIITSINGRRIDAANSLEEILSQYEPGDRLTLMLLRDGTTRQVFLTLGTRPAGLP